MFVVAFTYTKTFDFHNVIITLLGNTSEREMTLRAPQVQELSDLGLYPFYRQGT